MQRIGLNASRAVVGNGLIDVFGISLEGAVIAAVDTTRSGAAFDHEGLVIYPGFIDVHNHGALGVDVNLADAARLTKIAEFLASNGVTGWVPTLVPDTDDNYGRAIDAINEVMRVQDGKSVAQVLGVHYEGMFANEAMCGALRPQFFKKGRSAVGGGKLPRLDSGVHMTTMAPEIEGGIQLIEELVAEDWIVAIGHTKADVDTLDRAFATGARHLTHFFNAMTSVHHRDLGVAGWGLTKKNVTFDIIADGRHVAPEMLKFACRAKSSDKVSLISDSVAPTGLGDGEYELWGERVSVTKGKTRNAQGSIAGSVITMHDAVKQMLSLGFSETEVAAMASSNPAKLLGLDKERGSIEVGKRADLVGLNADGSIAFAMIGGVLSEPPA